MVALSQSAFIAGHMIWALSLGAISDRFVYSIHAFSSHVHFVLTATRVQNGPYMMRMLLSVAAVFTIPKAGLTAWVHGSQSLTSQ